LKSYNIETLYDYNIDLVYVYNIVQTGPYILFLVFSTNIDNKCEV
jgi:hypothetical protein